MSRLTDLYISPEALQELHSWLPSEEAAEELFGYTIPFPRIPEVSMVGEPIDLTQLLKIFSEQEYDSVQPDFIVVDRR